MSSPSKMTVPPSGSYTPVTDFIRVDLPAPLSPTSATTVPPSTPNDTPRSASTAPNRF